MLRDLLARARAGGHNLCCCCCRRSAVKRARRMVECVQQVASARPSAKLKVKQNLAISAAHQCASNADNDYSRVWLVRQCLEARVATLERCTIFSETSLARIFVARTFNCSTRSHDKCAVTDIRVTKRLGRTSATGERKTMPLWRLNSTCARAQADKWADAKTINGRDQWH